MFDSNSVSWLNCAESNRTRRLITIIFAQMHLELDRLFFLPKQIFERGGMDGGERVVSQQHIVQVGMEGFSETPFSLSNIMVLGQLGRGGTSHVFRVQSTRSKRLYAMKVIDKKAKNYHRPALQRELDIHRRLNHSTIVRLEGHIEDCDNHYVLTEYCEGGQMTRLLNEKLSQQTLATTLRQVAVGLSYLHAEGVAHCDLKLSNLLLQRGQIKICDFGFSQCIGESPSPEKPICGTIYYMAPQILRQKRRIFHKEGDIWALGICMLILITKKQPYSGDSFRQLRKEIINGDIQKIAGVSAELQDLMNRILEMNPQNRITLDAILTHPFLKKHQRQINQAILLKNLPSRQQKISKVEEVTNLVSQNESDQPQMPKFQPQAKKQQKQWTFKRNSKREQQAGNDETIQRKMSKGILSDNQKTVRQSKKKEDLPKKENIQQWKQSKRRITMDPIIDARLIKPLQDFHYKTKNDGFIHISKEGQISIKVKNIEFEITPDGDKLIINNKIISLKEMQQKGPGIYKQSIELYSYAKEVIQLLKQKQYAATWKQYREQSELLLGISLDWGKVRCLRKTKGINVLIQWMKGEETCQIREQGLKLTKKNIDQLGEDERQIIKIMQNNLCLEKHQQ